MTSLGLVNQMIYRTDADVKKYGIFDLGDQKRIVLPARGLTKLGTNHLLGVYMIYGIGMCICILYLIWEMAAKRKMAKKEDKVVDVKLKISAFQ